MMNFKKNRTLFLAACFSAAFLSCNNSTDSAAKTMDTAAVKPMDTVAATPPPPPEFKPFDIVEISHKVKDFAKWKPVFEADSVNRKAAGLQDVLVAKNNADTTSLTLVHVVADIAKAKSFAADPKLKETMKTAGVTSKPEFAFFHVLRFNADSKEKKWVMITHKVKDFDAWVKVYDGEGKDKRLSEGMVDVVLARGTDDPNIVMLVFDIKDMDKAKAAITSADKKKTMETAGVIGVPKITFYTTAIEY